MSHRHSRYYSQVRIELGSIAATEMDVIADAQTHDTHTNTIRHESDLEVSLSLSWMLFPCADS